METVVPPVAAEAMSGAGGSDGAAALGGGGAGVGGGAAAAAAGAGGSAGGEADTDPTPTATATAPLPAAVRKYVPPPLLASGIKLVVWDFDMTILAIHAWGERIQPGDVERRNMRVDFADLETFMGVVDALTAVGVHVAVASFGSYPTIQAYLDRVCEPGMFTRDNVSTPSSVGGTDGFQLAGGKTLQLEQLCHAYGVTPGQVMFFDDDRTNIELASKAGYLHSFHTPKGFTAAVWQAALAKFAS